MSHQPCAIAAVALLLLPTATGEAPQFQLVQPELFGVTGGQPNAWADYDGDGFLDLFVANYGPSALYRNDRGRRFVEVTSAAGLFFEQHATTPAWGDYDNDGRPDLSVAGFLVNVTHYPDHLFHNGGSAAGPHFADVLPGLVNEHDGSHGVQWIDFDGDGALDVALTNNDPAGGHYLFRNLLSAAQARRSLAVAVVDARGRHTKPGAEVRVYAAGTRRLMSSGLVDTGGGYCSQNVMPVHVATGGEARVYVGDVHDPRRTARHSAPRDDYRAARADRRAVTSGWRLAV